MSTATSALPKIDNIAPPKMAFGRLLYWSVSRELWENRYLYIAPLAVSGLIIVGFALGLVNLPETMRAAAALEPAKQHDALELPYTMAALLLMFVMFLSAMFYCLEALYGERRDRSVLFWKSLPVSDTMVVLAKASIPFLVVPLLSFAFTLMTQGTMLLLAGGRLMGTGLSVWSHLSPGEMSWTLFYHLVVGHGLWYAPIWGWLLLCSAWSRRMPFLWATLPLLAVGLVEKIAFNTSRFGHWLMYRLSGDPGGDPGSARAGGMSMESMTPPLAHFVTSPGLWFGLALAAVFLVIAIRLRRYQEPI